MTTKSVYTVRFRIGQGTCWAGDFPRRTLNVHTYEPSRPYMKQTSNIEVLALLIKSQRRTVSKQSTARLTAHSDLRQTKIL